MSAINFIHTVFSVIALLAGGFIFFNAKGTRQHVQAGWLYVASMLILLFTSFFIFDLFGSFGAFHVLSIVSLVTMGLGMYFPLSARSNAGWLIQHYMWMSYSWLGNGRRLAPFRLGARLTGVAADVPVLGAAVYTWVFLDFPQPQADFAGSQSAEGTGGCGALENVPENGSPRIVNAELADYGYNRLTSTISPCLDLSDVLRDFKKFTARTILTRRPCAPPILRTSAARPSPRISAILKSIIAG